MLKKKHFHYLFAVFCIAFTLGSCSKDDDKAPLAADFETTVSNSGIAPVEVTIVNKTTGANSYAWKFASGNPATSTQKDPGKVTFSTPGTHTIKLVASSGSESMTIEKTITVTRSSAIITYSNVKLSGRDGHATSGAFFSTETGKVYKASEVTAEIGPKIDITFVGISGMRFFSMPTKVQDSGFTAIPGATQTDFINYIETSTISFSVADFDSMTDDTKVKDLTIFDDNNSFGSTVPRIVLFKNAKDQKGVIKIKELVTGASGYVICDIKLQKDALL